MPKNYKEKQSKNKLKRKTHCDPITHHMGAGFVIAKTMHQAGNRTRVCTVAGYYSTTRPLVLVWSLLLFSILLL